MKYIFEGIEYTELPKKLTLPDGSDISPIRDEAMFVAMGGIISEELTPKEKVIASLNELVSQLAPKVPQISIAQFKQAALTMLSGDLIAYARQMEVPEEIIAEARSRVVDIFADAMRMGMNWNELINGIEV